jgi:hypothetical protein
LQYRVNPDGHDDGTAAWPDQEQGENVMGVARNAEVWIFGGLVALLLAACLDGKTERARPASAVSAVSEVELAQPQAGSQQPMYVVYVVGKRPSAAEKRAMRASKG